MSKSMQDNGFDFRSFPIDPKYIKEDATEENAVGSMMPQVPLSGPVISKQGTSTEEGDTVADPNDIPEGDGEQNEDVTDTSLKEDFNDPEFSQIAKHNYFAEQAELCKKIHECKVFAEKYKDTPLYPKYLHEYQEATREYQEFCHDHNLFLEADDDDTSEDPDVDTNTEDEVPPPEESDVSDDETPEEPEGDDTSDDETSEGEEDEEDSSDPGVDKNDYKNSIRAKSLKKSLENAKTRMEKATDPTLKKRYKAEYEKLKEDEKAYNSRSKKDQKDEANASKNINESTVGDWIKSVKNRRNKKNSTKIEKFEVVNVDSDEYRTTEKEFKKAYDKITKVLRTKVSKIKGFKIEPFNFVPCDEGTQMFICFWNLWDIYPNAREKMREDSDEWAKLYSSVVDTIESAAKPFGLTVITDGDWDDGVIDVVRKGKHYVYKNGSEFTKYKDQMIDLKKEETDMGYIDDMSELFEESTLFTEAADIAGEMKPIIEALNNKGYKTKYSSPGYSKSRSKDDVKRDGAKNGKLYSTARIMFDGDYNFPPAPDGWEWRQVDKKDYLDVKEKTFNDESGESPDAQFAEWKEDYMSSLKAWVAELPKAGTKRGDSSENPDDEKEVKESASVMESFDNIMGDIFGNI